MIITAAPTARASQTLLIICCPSPAVDPNSWQNTVAACTRCNNRKANRTPSEAGDDSGLEAQRADLARGLPSSELINAC